MICFPNAKINLGLNILSKRSDGFHQIESALYPVPLYDAIEFNPSERFQINAYGLPLFIEAGQNIIFKTWEILNREFQIPPIEIHLLKGIPHGTGLGGGSADAAFLINCLNHNMSLNLDHEKRKAIAADIGSDCPFFIDNKPAVVSGRGELTHQLELSLSGKFLVLVFPGITISTQKAYSLATPNDDQPGISEIIKRPVHAWKDQLKNDFELPLFELYPELEAIKNELYKRNALYASLTGSGSAIYGIFDAAPDPDFFSLNHKIRILAL